MNKVLEKLKQENILCEIYENLDETDKFYVGYILSIDDGKFIFESVPSDGKYDGYYCTFIDSIIQIKYNTRYLKNIEKLMSLNDFKRSNLELDGDNLQESFLRYIKANKLMCQIELLNDYTCVLIGYVSSVDSETVNIALLDENGKKDGTGIAKISDISCVSIGTEELQKLKILE